MFEFLRKKKPAAAQTVKIPAHVAIIMDGNGRWAQRRGLARTAGHYAGSENFRKIAIECGRLGVKYLTVFAFSTENWSRPKDEVDTIIGLLAKYMRESCRDLVKNNAKLCFFGDLSAFSSEIASLKAELDELSKKTTGIQVNICLNYGGRDEIVRAARILAQRCASGDIMPEDIDAQALAQNLYSAGIPDPDLLIKPGGEFRISNFLLWQLAYTEFYFTDVLWPDFDERELMKAFVSFSGRNRRYGGIN